MNIKTSSVRVTEDPTGYSYVQSRHIKASESASEPDSVVFLMMLTLQ